MIQNPRRVALTTLLMLFVGLPAYAQKPYAQNAAQRADTIPMTDEEAVRLAVEDYLLALYDVEPERIDRSVSPDLVKFGWYRTAPEADYMPTAMSFQQLRDLSARWNLENQQGIDDGSPRAIRILDVMDQTASAKLTALWGIDYFQLQKVEGRWMIRHVLWQSHPAG